MHTWPYQLGQKEEEIEELRFQLQVWKQSLRLVSGLASWLSKRLLRLLIDPSPPPNLVISVRHTCYGLVPQCPLPQVHALMHMMFAHTHTRARDLHTQRIPKVQIETIPQLVLFRKLKWTCSKSWRSRNRDWYGNNAYTHDCVVTR